jgi:hypothetical protein
LQYRKACPRERIRTAAVQSLDEKIEILRHAIGHRKQVTGVGAGLPRAFCAHSLGRTGEEWRVLAWQFDGRSDTGPLPAWRCFRLQDLDDLTLHEGRWHRGTTPARGPVRCVQEAEAVVDPEFGPEPADTSPRGILGLGPRLAALRRR